MQACDINWPLLLEYLKLVLAWPVLGLVFVVWAVSKFEREIGDRLANIRNFDFGGAKVQMSTPDQAEQLAKGKDPGEAGTALVAGVSSASATATASAVGTVVAAGAAAVAAPTVLEWQSSDPERAKAAILNWWRVAKFESIMNVIYGTQFRLLQALASVGTAGQGMDALRLFHQEHVQAQGVLHEPEFFGNLAGADLLHIEGDRAYITEWGQTFLAHIAERYGNAAPFMRGG